MTVMIDTTREGPTSSSAWAAIQPASGKHSNERHDQTPHEKARHHLLGLPFNQLKASIPEASLRSRGDPFEIASRVGLLPNPSSQQMHTSSLIAVKKRPF